MIIKGVFQDELYVNDELEKFEVSFELHVDFKDGSFQGTAIDEQSKDYIIGKIVVKGFVEDDFISFTKDYPHDYDYNPETNEFFAVKDQKHDGVTYKGFLDKEDNKFKGNWFVKFNEQKDNLFQTEYFIDNEAFGYWEMENKFI